MLLVELGEKGVEALRGPSQVVLGGIGDDTKMPGNAGFFLAREVEGRHPEVGDPQLLGEVREELGLVHAPGQVEVATGFQDGRCSSKIAIASSCRSVKPMSSRPSRSRQRV